MSRGTAARHGRLSGAVQLSRRPCIPALVLLTVLARGAAAQQRPAADTITGRVVARDSTPIPMATVRATGEGSRSASATTDSTGRYTLVVPNGSGAYELTVRAFGYAQFTTVVQRDPGSARIPRDFRLNPIAVALQPVKVVAPVRQRGPPTPGERGESWQSMVSEKYPVNPGDIADIAALEPGVVRSGPDGSQISIAGQSPDQNRTTVDGATYSGGSLPAEGVRSAGVITNTFDVARGQFTGGQLVATTLSGTNRWGGAFTARGTDPALQYGGSARNLGVPAQRFVALSGGAGGAFVRDRLFAYSALDLSRTSSPAFSLTQLDPAAAPRLGLAPDSARRFLDIAQRLGLYAPAGATTESRSDYASLLTRIDYTISERHSLTTRLDWRGSASSGLGASPMRLMNYGAAQTNRDGGVLAQLTSALGRWSNELRLYGSAGRNRSDPGFLPVAGQVVVLSTLQDGATGSASLGFGGAAYAPDRNRSLLEAADELVHETDGGRHRTKAGFLLQEQRASVLGTGNRFGTFTFNSLADLEAGRPASFTRNLVGSPGSALLRYAALYAGDTWTPHRRLGLTYGLRLEVSRYDGRLAPAALADSIAGDARRRPANLLAMPRLGFRYDVPGRGSWTVDGGVGSFAGVVPVEGLATLSSQTGSTALGLICVGPASASPEWQRYAGDPGAIPSTCADGTSIFAGLAPQAGLFGRGFGMPRTWRASLGAGGNLTGRVGAHVRGLLVRGTNLPSALDLNLVPTPGFTLPLEGDRPVYAEPAEIDRSTGGIAPGASRRDPSLGTVRELGGLGRSWTGQITGGVGGFGFRNTLMSVDYTFTRSRVLTSAVPAVGAITGSTAGDPARLEWSDAGFAPRHVFQLMANQGFRRRYFLSAIGRLTSGVAFTPLVQGDINGDGFANDRAFVFSPAATADTSLARGMAQLLRTAPAPVRDCLAKQTGRIAAPGSCRTGWSPSLDIRAEMYALGNINTRRLILTLTASNVTAGLDYLLHGPDRLRGWGQFPFPDPTLLQVRGFDADARAFRYAVNPRFGQPLGGGLMRLPFRITLQARITIGDDPRYQPMMRAIEAGMGNAAASIRSALAEQIRNVPAVVLQLARSDSGVLRLTLPQQARLQAVADPLGPSIEMALDTLTASFQERGPTTAARTARRQDRIARAVSLAELALRRTREILTPQQWARLPAWLVRAPEVQRIQRPTMQMSIPGTEP